MTERWQRQAECRGIDTNLFFPPPSEEVSPEVKAMCRSCPVREPCLDYALRDWTLVGIWAGTSNKERQRLRRRRASELAPISTG